MGTKGEKSETMRKLHNQINAKDFLFECIRYCLVSFLSLFEKRVFSFLNK
jgi:hypothetical protein